MSQPSPDNISSREKAAILIRVLDEDLAAQVIELLDDEERETLAREIIRLRSHQPEVLMAVLGQFLQEMQVRELELGTTDREYIKRIFRNMPENAILEMLEDMTFAKDNPFEFLNTINDVDSLLTILNEESPQTIAIIASHIKPQIASRLIEKLPEHKMVETVTRIAKLEQVDSELLNQIGELLKAKMMKMSFGVTNKTDGLKTIVNILNNVPRGIEKIVFEKLDENDYELSEKIKESMFVFEDLLRLDDLALRRVLEEIRDNLLLAKALKNSKEEMKEKLFTCMSSSRRDMILEELETLGPLKITDAEKAQQTITGMVKQLEKEGKIVIQRGEEDVLI